MEMIVIVLVIASIVLGALFLFPKSSRKGRASITFSVCLE